jgi:ribonuclease R
MSPRNKKQSKSKKSQKTKKQSGNKVLVVSGVIDINRNGVGFVKVEGVERDIIVYPENLNTALKGDHVKIDLFINANHGNKRTEGKVKEIVKRKQSEFIGVLDVKPNFAFLVPNNKSIPIDVFIPIESLHGAKNGDKAIVRVVEWRKTKNPVGEVIKVLDNQSINEMAMREIISENGFEVEFPDDAIEESLRLSDVLDKNEIARRLDYRDITTFTIDPIDAKDFDDALSIQFLENDIIEVGVHIADVSHYVSVGSALDQEAYQRATSVYLPDRVIPMLPEHISNGLCSLRPHEDKFTFSAIFKLNHQGEIIDFKIAKTVINSNHRFAYEDAQLIIEGAESEFRSEIVLLDKLAKQFRKQRFKNGAINFSSSEVRFQLDENAVPIGIIVKESKAAHQLVEEWMLLANKYVATFMSKKLFNDKPLPFPYRVHDAPIEDKLNSFVQFVAKFGYKLITTSPEVLSKSFNELLKNIQGKPEQHAIESLGIRTMSKAIYTTSNVGHYGLGFEFYCHFTSPIRRYPDVLVHRIVNDVLEGKIVPMKGLEEMCKHCSMQERNAMEAERQATKYKQVEYMQQFVGEEFEGVISGVAAFGLWVETIAHKCEGMISINSLLDIDRFEYVENEFTLRGKNTGLKFTFGDIVKVKVLSANLEKVQIDFMLTEVPKTKTKSKRKS